MSEWGFVRVGFGPSGVMSSGVMYEWGFVQWGYVRLPFGQISVQNIVVDGKHSPFVLSVSFDRIPLDESQRHWSHLFSCVSE